MDRTIVKRGGGINNEVLVDLQGRRVKIWATGPGMDVSFVDEGVLEAYDDPWLRLRALNGELLYLSSHTIRVVREVAPASPH
ncbi:MAG: hypothetical protein M3Y56_06005 [Armatimonadota bacterium]|nr:hypothetical protein [Armatimonadota bacterium]